MENLNISLAQIEVISNRPDLNTEKIIQYIDKAKKEGSKIVVFPEMVVPGYLIGDEFENDSFIEDILYYNEKIKEASKGITVIWGSIDSPELEKGEDGRRRKYNSAFIAQNGKWINNGIFEGKTYKTLMPKYREFDDERHFYSLSKLAVENREYIKDLLQPFEIEIDGVRRKVGIILCEDMWSDDYSINPTKILIENGAEIIINLSCSPWTWRKNDKRNRVVSNHIKGSGVDFYYCNSVGIQNNGKNIFLLDGSSTIYNGDGEIVKVAKVYEECLLNISNQCVETHCNASLPHNVISDENHVNIENEDRDMKELFEGLIYGLKKFFKGKSEKVVIGLSGGIDSALVAALLSIALGPNNVYAVNMPSKFNSDTTKNAALDLAKNLGINYGVAGIQDSVDFTIDQLSNLSFENLGNGIKTDCTVNDFAKENIQARDRGSRLLAGISASLGALFTNNGNKTEAMLGYATLYGDTNGAIAPIGDLWKGEVYALAKYINKLYGNEIIPQSIIDVVPSAELSENQNVDEGMGDPIKYEYHDKLGRAFVEFRKDPDQILAWYLEGKLDKNLGLPKGSVNKYFKDGKSFVFDLEEKWKLFKRGVFKRIQFPPVIAVSKRAFGFDLRESQNEIYFTRKYYQLKTEIIGDS